MYASIAPCLEGGSSISLLPSRAAPHTQHTLHIIEPIDMCGSSCDCGQVAVAVEVVVELSL